MFLAKREHGERPDTILHDLRCVCWQQHAPFLLLSWPTLKDIVVMCLCMVSEVASLVDRNVVSEFLARAIAKNRTFSHKHRSNVRSNRACYQKLFPNMAGLEFYRSSC